MRLKDIGEFGLIEKITSETLFDKRSVITGIGDDAAVLLPARDSYQLLATDMLVEEVHFSLSTTTARQLGYKAVAVNLSDIAAMGGLPRHIVVSLALPAKLPVEFVAGLYDGMRDICREFGINIVGGDTVASRHDLIINIAVVGEVEPLLLKRRCGARIGDVVAVTGTLGDSGAGLDLLQQNKAGEFDFAGKLTERHLTPRPPLTAGRRIAAAGATSMEDISDGLARESNEIAEASGVQVRLRAADIPLSPEVKKAARVTGKPALSYALYGGEDYQLLFTIGPENLALLKKSAPTGRFTVIGDVVAGAPGVSLLYPDGRRTLLKPDGYCHFR